MGVPEAAEYLGVVIRTVYRLINTGGLAAYKVGPGDPAQAGGR